MMTPSFTVLDARFQKLAFGNVHLEKLWTGCRWAELWAGSFDCSS